MYGSGGAESFFVTLPIAVAVFAILWVPFWLIGVYRWRVKHNAGLSASWLLRASVIWPFVALLFSAVGGSLSVAYANGPARQAHAYASQLVDEQETLAFVNLGSSSRRWEGCGIAGATTFVRNQDGQRVEQNPLPWQTAVAAAEAVGWSDIEVNLPLGDYRTTRITGTKDHANLTYQLHESGTTEIYIKACRDSTVAGNGTAGVSGRAGVDATLFGVAAAWAVTFALGYTLWGWAKTKSATIRKLCALAVVIVVAIACAIASNIWIG